MTGLVRCVLREFVSVGALAAFLVMIAVWGDFLGHGAPF